MYTAVDSCILLDVFLADPKHVRASASALRKCLGDGRVVACDVVWAEVSSLFESPEAANKAMRTLGIFFEPLTEAASVEAGTIWRQYRLAGGTRKRIAADFMIGAHALTQADRLLTRDKGFFRDHFAPLAVLTP